MKTGTRFVILDGKRDENNIKNTLLKECDDRGFIYDENNPEIAFVIGGDGTFLRAIHKYIDIVNDIKFIGIRSGSLGFFYDFIEEDIKTIFFALDNDDYLIDSHHLIECDFSNKKIYAVNEIRFENPFHTLVNKVKIDGYELETFHGNGLLICNELGSSAYNKSLGGSLISHNLKLLELTEISTIQNNAYRSLGSSLISPRETIFTFEGNFSSLVIGYDHLTCETDGANLITVKSSKKELHIIYLKDHNYLKSIKRSFIK